MRSNLTLNYGLRYEAQINPQPDEPNPLLAGSDQVPSDTNNFGPRLGFSWDPWKDNRGIVRFNTGLFFSRTPALLIVSPFTSNGAAQQQLTFTPTTAGRADLPEHAVGASHRGGHAAEQRQHLRSRLPESAYVPDERRRRARDRAPTSRSVPTIRTRRWRTCSGCSTSTSRPPPAWRPTAGCSIRSPRPNPNFNLIVQAESTARGMYNAMTLSAKRRWSSGGQWYNQGLQYQAFYTYAHTKDDDSNERKFQDIFYQDWQNLGAEYTWSNNDIRHNFVMNATWAFAGDVQVGAIFNVRSGAPVQPPVEHRPQRRRCGQRQRPAVHQRRRHGPQLLPPAELLAAGSPDQQDDPPGSADAGAGARPVQRAERRQQVRVRADEQQHRRPATSCSRTTRTWACRTRFWALR